ncbi:hypothetical protein [Compostimonas suwonensis]|uniref:Uncharacterized protein n=1 Tax=Compostimonas suwonensis TaxID=1048394 RepID=A0A2M9C4B8_9MICO|nr:hypothetical protein [Compostimonas suwonensis]PJJ65368.1 hypothetical protein CLV54_0400 [Compostimonas suwonensis]
MTRSNPYERALVVITSIAGGFGLILTIVGFRQQQPLPSLRSG